jgi:WD40 repeat protein
VVTASEDKTARVWDAATGTPIGQPLRPDGFVYRAAFSPEGARVVTASDDKTARLWEAATGVPVGQLLRQERWVTSAAFSTLVVTASGDGTARVWEVEAFNLLQHDAQVTSASFSPDSKRVVTASANVARVWDAATGALIAKTMQHEEAINSAQFSPKGASVVTASDDETARLWDAVTGGPIGKLLQHNDDVLGAAFSPNGKQVVTASVNVPQVVGRGDRNGDRQTIAAQEFGPQRFVQPRIWAQQVALYIRFPRDEYL